MSDFDKIYESHRKEIETQSKILNQSQPIEIPRDSMRRPWSSDFDFLNQPEAQKPSSGPKIEGSYHKDSVINLPWYATAKGLLNYTRRRAYTSLVLFCASVSVLSFFASSVPPKYYSATHIYVPAKLDSISSRLNSFMDKPEFASIPVGLKIPVSLVTKDLESAGARKWVLENLPEGINPSAVSVNAGYGLASEVLIIHGFASRPDDAVQVSRLYQQYFENKLHDYRLEHLGRIDQWADLRLSKVNQSLDELRPQLTSFSDFSSNQQKVLSIQQKLSDKAAELVLRKINIQRLRNQLLNFSGVASTKTLEHPELQEMLDIYHGLKSRQGDSSLDEKTKLLYNEERRKIEGKIRQTVIHLTRTTQKDIQDLDLEISKIQSEVSRYGAQGTDIKYASGLEADLNQKIAQLEGQREDLMKLKAQIQLDMTGPSGQYKVIQYPVADPSTQSPRTYVLYGAVFLASIFLTILLLMLWQWIRPLNLAMEPRTREV